MKGRRPTTTGDGRRRGKTREAFLIFCRNEFYGVAQSPAPPPPPVPPVPRGVVRRPPFKANLKPVRSPSARIDFSLFLVPRATANDALSYSPTLAEKGVRKAEK